MGRSLEERASELQRKVEELEERVRGGRRPIISPVPERPTDEEVREHYTTHAPPKSWCPYCAKGRSTNDPHRKQRKEVPDVEAELSATPTISVDLMYLYEKGERPTLVAVDHETGRIWSYALRDKTILGGTGWIQRRIAQDIDNAGHKEAKIMVKSDQEKSMVALQHEIKRLREAKTILQTVL